MNCINFDLKFEQYMGVWVKNNAAKYKDNMDTIERRSNTPRKSRASWRPKRSTRI